MDRERKKIKNERYSKREREYMRVTLLNYFENKNSIHIYISIFAAIVFFLWLGQG